MCDKSAEQLEAMFRIVLFISNSRGMRQEQPNKKLPAGAIGKGAFGLVYKASKNGVEFAGGCSPLA